VPHNGWMDDQPSESPEPKPRAEGFRLRRREFRLDVKAVRPAPIARWIRLVVLGIGAIVSVVIYVSTMRERRGAAERAADAGHAVGPARLSGTSIMWVKRPPSTWPSATTGQDAGAGTPR
jgi:hypothetical protein